MKRVVKSTLAAECLAELEGAEMAFRLFHVIFYNHHLRVKFCQPSVSLIIGLRLILYILRKHSQT